MLNRGDAISLSPLYLFLYEFLESDGVLGLQFLLLLQLLLEDKTRREGMAVDALVTAGTLPEPAVDTLLNRMEKMLTNLKKKNVRICTHDSQPYNTMITK